MARKRKRAPAPRQHSPQSAGEDDRPRLLSRRGTLSRVPRGWDAESDVSPFAVRGKWARPVRE